MWWNTHIKEGKEKTPKTIIYCRYHYAFVCTILDLYKISPLKLVDMLYICNFGSVLEYYQILFLTSPLKNYCVYIKL